MEKLDGKSLDLVEENRKALVEALGKIVPEVVSEGNVDLAKLSILLGKDKDLSDKLERYNFTWPDKRKAIKAALTPSTGTLRPAQQESVNWESTQNLYIEGDNFEVLKLLQKSYFEKVKMIYIDPPYNKGKEFVYPDDYVDSIQNYLELTGQINESGRRITTNTETSGRYHTNWLNMMYPRLKLARNLLTDDGVIFISIDDNEVTNLRKICDEIFGEENFVAQLIWKKKQGGGNDSTNFVVEHEYVLVFSKLIESLKLYEDKCHILNDALYPYKDEKGEYGLVTLDKSSIRFSESLVFEIKDSFGKSYFPRIVKGKQSCWRWSKEKVEKEFDSLVFKNSNVYTKYYRPDGVTPRSLLSDPRFGRTETGKEEVTEIMGGNFFSYPKPLGLEKHLLNISTKSNDIILDFFSGSATTAHAVMELNKEDGGNRQFIMVQLPEPCDKDSEAFKAGYKNICEIGKERIRRAIKKIEAEYAESEKLKSGELDLGDVEAKPKPDLGFKVFKLDTSNFIPWDNNPDNFNEKTLNESVSNIKWDRSQQDLLFELFLKLGVKLTTPYKKVNLAGKNMYDIGGGVIYACLDDDIGMDFCNAMLEYHEKQFPQEDAQTKKEERELEKYRLKTTTFIFRDSSFSNDNVKTNILQTLRQNGLKNIRAI